MVLLLLDEQPRSAVPLSLTNTSLLSSHRLPTHPGDQVLAKKGTPRHAAHLLRANYLSDEIACNRSSLPCSSSCAPGFRIEKGTSRAH